MIYLKVRLTILMANLFSINVSSHMIKDASRRNSTVSFCFEKPQKSISLGFNSKINRNDIDFCDFSRQDGTTELLLAASLLIWDEAYMEKRFVIEMVDRTLRNIMDSTSFFLYTIVGCNPWK